MTCSFLGDAAITKVPASSKEPFNCFLSSSSFSSSVSSLIEPFNASVFLSRMLSYCLLSFSKSFYNPSTKSFANAALLAVLYDEIIQTMNITHDGRYQCQTQSGLNLNAGKLHLSWFGLLAVTRNCLPVSSPTSCLWVFPCSCAVLLESWSHLKTLISPISNLSN